jgi:AAA family ATP:ADP antiporter
MGRWFSIEVANRARAWAAAAVLLITMAGHTVLETARDSLFLARVPVTQLPFTYAAIAVAALFAAEIDARLQAHFSRRRLLTITLLVGAGGSLAFVVPFREHMSWAPHAFYVWLAVFATVAIAQFWLALSELFTVAEAKRLYVAISVGGLIGAVLGGALARLAVHFAGDSSLLVVGAVLWLIASLVPELAARGTVDVVAPRPGPHGNRGAAFRNLRGERYLRYLLALTLLATVSVTLIDYLFKAEVVRAIAPERLSRFFSSFNAWMSGAALLAQLLIAPRLLDSLGVGRALLVMPAALAVSSAGALLVPGLLALVLLRGIDGTFRHSLQRSAVEVLYLPLPAQVRARWKLVVDVLGQRGGQALASALILACIAAAVPSSLMLGLALLLAVGWLALAATMESRYLSLFRARIKAGAIETRAEVPALDLRSLESLVAALGSESDDEVLATIDLLCAYDRAHVIPALLLVHPSRAVVIRTLEVFASSGRRDYAGAARRLLARDDDEIRAAATLALAGQMPPDELLAELDKTLSVAARAAVLVALSARGLPAQSELEREIDFGCSPAADLATRLAFARAFRLQGDRCCVQRLSVLAQDAGPELEIETARAMLSLPHADHIPALVRMLASHGARPIARDALHALGEEALAALGRACEDAELPRRVRAHLPRSISRFGSAKAADLLLDRLDRERDGWVRFKSIRGLGQLRQHLTTPERTRRVLAHARQNALRAAHFVGFRLAIASQRGDDPRGKTQGGELLAAVLLEKEAHAIDRAVRLIGLLHSANVIHNIRQALVSRNRRLRADGIELLVHPVPRDLGEAVSALLEPAPDAVRLARAADALREAIEPPSYQECLRRLLEDDSEAVRCVAAYHTGELGLHALSGSVAAAAQGTVDRASGEVFARVEAILALGGAIAPPRLAVAGGGRHET